MADSVNSSTELSLLDFASAEDLVEALKRRCDILVIMYALPKNTEDESQWQFRRRDKGDSFTLLGIARHLEREYESHLQGCMEEG